MMPAIEVEANDRRPRMLRYSGGGCAEARAHKTAP
jgi:hypothetical protein